jgi:hypothetical protein
MMSRTINILLLIFLMVAGINLLGQQKADSRSSGKTKGGIKHMFMPTVYLGNSDYKGGPIQKDKFVALMKQGLTSRDSLGNKYHVVDFDFSYAEKKVYEDSMGNLMRITDFSTERCYGDTLSWNLTESGDTLRDGEVRYGIYDRAKPGDTIYFDHIMVEKRGRNSVLMISDTIPIAARGIKCVIVN